MRRSIRWSMILIAGIVTISFSFTKGVDAADARKETTPAAREEQKNDRAGLMEQAARKLLVAYLEKQVPAFSDTTPLVLAAVASMDPRSAVDFYQKAISRKEKGGEDYMVSSGLLLSRVLKGAYLKRLIDLLKKSDYGDLQFLAAEILFPDDPGEAVAIAKNVQAPPDEKELAALLFVASMKARQIKGWEKALAVVPSRQETQESKNVMKEVFFDMVRIHRDEDIEGLKKLLVDPRFSGRMALYNVLQGFLDNMIVRDNENRTSGTYARFYLAAARSADKLSAFVLASYAAYLSNFESSSDVVDVLRKSWSADIVKSDYGIDHAAAFFAMRALLEADSNRALEIGSALTDRFLSAENKGRYDHAASTTAGVMALKDPAAAFAVADRIVRLEWHVHAKRGVFRKWAEVQPVEALKAEKKRTEWGDWAERIAQDISLEAAVGASKTRPDLALYVLSLLPDDPDRFQDGICLVAPAIAEKDRAKAMEMIMAGGLELTPPAATTLSWVLLGNRVKNIVIRYRPFFPDWAAPVDAWPGPTLSRPLRFSPPGEE